MDITDTTEEQYPAAIGVYCDRCGTEERNDFIVTDSTTREQRFEIARAHLRETAGWSCTEAGDLCPNCRTADTWTITPDSTRLIWDADIVAHCKPHYGTNPDTGLIEVDGLTIWPASSTTGERVVARFGDTITLQADGRYTVHHATVEG